MKKYECCIHCKYWKTCLITNREYVIEIHQIAMVMPPPVRTNHVVNFVILLGFPRDKKIIVFSHSRRQSAYYTCLRNPREQHKGGF